MAHGSGGHGPFVVGVTDQVRHPGTQHRVEVRGPLPGLALSTAWVPDDAEVAADLVLEAMTDGRVTATGRIAAPWVGECRRCLQPVTGVTDTRVQEVFEAHPVEGDTYLLDADRVDLEPLVRDAVLLALPLAPLCRPDCPGPDPEHPVVVEGELDDEGPGAGDGEDDQPADPRWAGLRELHFD